MSRHAGKWRAHQTSPSWSDELQGELAHQKCQNRTESQSEDKKFLQPQIRQIFKTLLLITYFCFFFSFAEVGDVLDTESKVNICQYLELAHVPMNGLFKNPLGCFDWFTYLESLAARAKCLPWERLHVLEILLPSALPSVRRVQKMSDALLDFFYLLVDIACLWQTFRVQSSQVCR